MSQVANPTQRSPAPTIDVIQEVRIAVVMYGGVSLAIYINGVAQELLSLVRSTAAGAPPPRDSTGVTLQDGGVPAWKADHELEGAEPVYREIARMLSEPFRSATGASDLNVAFAVDILSGTSAGGINAIFLAKAMANGTDMEQLKELWISQGDLSLLLNDRGSTGDMPRGYRLDPKPSSLLNSQRMYVQLRKALDGMDPKDSPRPSNGSGCREWTPVGEPTPPPPPRSPLARGVTLYITATDLSGVVKPIQLWDKRVYERAYRGVFRFVYANDGNESDWRHDFRPVDNPFLAFAARCTSSFPVAFEPMTLGDVLEVSPGGDHDRLRECMTEWNRFFRGYLPRPGPDFAQRSFGDGGYLDNKPFGHVIDELQYRRAETLVDRKLIYVEPAPENLEREGDLPPRPNAFENLGLASFALPRAETIREDVERLRARNELIERISRATRNIDQDVLLVDSEETKESPGDEWAKRWLRELIIEYGASYGPYHRLKVAALTTDLAEMVTRVARYDEDSQEFDAIRYLVSAWRQKRYASDPDAESPGIESENRMLMDFDLAYRLRRIAFLRSRIDIVLGGQGPAHDLIQAISRKDKLDPEESNRFRNAVLPELRRVREILSHVHSALRTAARQLRSPESSGLRDALERFAIGSDDLVGILKDRDPRKRRDAARDLLKSAATREPLESTVQLLRDTLTEEFKSASARCRAVFDAPVPENEPERKQLMAYLARCYNKYDHYDIVLFPMQYGTEFGEGQQVQLLRISPQDATTLIQEFDDAGQRRLRKLAGTALGNFGGFLDATWRKSDILWGRLDAADRLIPMLLSNATSVVPPLEVEELVVRAQRGILEQTFENMGVDEARDMLVECALRATTQEDGRRELCRMLSRITTDRVSSTPKMLEVLDRRAILDRFADRYENSRNLPPEHALRLISRATTVFGRLIDGLSDRYRWIRRTVPAHIVWAGQILWGLIEVAVPGGFFRIAANWWWKLIYALTILMVVIGSLTAETQVRNVGLVLLASALTLDVIRRLLGVLLTLGEGWRRRATMLLGIVFLLALGVAVGVVIQSRLPANQNPDSWEAWLREKWQVLGTFVADHRSLVLGFVAGLVAVWAVNRFVTWRWWIARRRERNRPRRRRSPTTVGDGRSTSA